MSGTRCRAAITGCGALCALGSGVEAFWQGLLAGRSGVGEIQSFVARGFANARAGEVTDLDPTRDLSTDEIGRLDRVAQYAMVAVREALAEARLRLAVEDTTRVGVIFATTLGGMPLGESYLWRKLRGGDPAARQLLHFPYYAVASRVARELNVRGPVVSPSIACASGTQAVGLALELIRRGDADVLVVGGAETVSPFIISGFNCLRATTSDAVRPFDARRSGLLIGEGAAALVVEEFEHARARGVEAEVEVLGTGLSADAVHMTAPARDGCGAARAMRAALADARVAAEEVDFVSAHGTGTVFNDAMEVAALRAVLGDRAGRVPVNGIKGAIGHTLGAAGAFEAILCVRVLRHGLIPPTVGCREIDPDNPLDVVRGAVRRADVRTALSTSSAFAGNNAAIVLRRIAPRAGGQGGKVVPFPERRATDA